MISPPLPPELLTFAQLVCTAQTSQQEAPHSLEGKLLRTQIAQFVATQSDPWLQGLMTETVNQLEKGEPLREDVATLAAGIVCAANGEHQTALDLFDSAGHSSTDTRVRLLADAGIFSVLTTIGNHTRALTVGLILQNAMDSMQGDLPQQDLRAFPTTRFLMLVVDSVTPLSQAVRGWATDT